MRGCADLDPPPLGEGGHEVVEGVFGRSGASGKPSPPPFGRSPSPNGGGSGDAVVAAARTWLGTPYQHQASLKGVGCDCLGLVRGVWRDLYGAEPQAPPPYRADWAKMGDEETLLDAARRWLEPADPADPRRGDVLLFRMSPGALVKHCAIVSADGAPEPRIIHAYWGRAAVESWLGPWWRRRIVAAFRFPAKAAKAQA